MKTERVNKEIQSIKTDSSNKNIQGQPRIKTGSLRSKEADMGQRILSL